MKKAVVLFLSMILLVTHRIGVCAMEEPIKKVFIDSLVMQIDNPMAYTRSLDVYVDYENLEVCPFVEEGVVYVPLRFLFEYQGGRVKWDNQTQQVVIYYADKKYYLSDRELHVDDQTIALEYPVKSRNERSYISIVEWNDKVLKRQLSLHKDYIVLTSPQNEIPEGFWPLMDKYFRDFTGKYGELKQIYKNGLYGLADKDGNVIIEPKYDGLFYKVNKPIIVVDRDNRVSTVMTEEEEILFQVQKLPSLRWLAGEPNSLSTIGGFYGGHIPGYVYDITGERADLRVNENLVHPPYGGIPAGSTYTNGLKVETDLSGQSILKNKSGNILYTAVLPDGLRFTQNIRNDQLMIVDKDYNICAWLDLEGNLNYLSEN